MPYGDPNTTVRPNHALCKAAVTLIFGQSRDCVNTLLTFTVLGGRLEVGVGMS